MQSASSLAKPPVSILLVDDTPANLLALAAVLKPLGARILEASSGKEAIEHVARESFAVVLESQRKHLKRGNGRREDEDMDVDMAGGAEGDGDMDEEEEERLDAMCPLYDQLSLKSWWWILEIFPIEQCRQLKDNRWKKYTS